MGHWIYVLAAYALVFGVLLVYWWRVESAIRTLERERDSHSAGARP
jgi:HAMP domain-containing protein